MASLAISHRLLVCLFVKIPCAFRTFNLIKELINKYIGYLFVTEIKNLIRISTQPGDDVI